MEQIIEIPLGEYLQVKMSENNQKKEIADMKRYLDDLYDLLWIGLNDSFRLFHHSYDEEIKKIRKYGIPFFCENQFNQVIWIRMTMIYGQERMARTLKTLYEEDEGNDENT